jgi:ribosomal protein L14
MLQMESTVNILDNTGVYTTKVISLYDKPFVTINDVVLTAVDTFRRGKTFQKKYLCFLTASSCFKQRKSGVFIKSDKNIGVLLKDSETFLGSKFRGPVFAECKSKKINKIHFLFRRLV